MGQTAALDLPVVLALLLLAASGAYSMGG